MDKNKACKLFLESFMGCKDKLSHFLRTYIAVWWTAVLTPSLIFRYSEFVLCDFTSVSAFQKQWNSVMTEKRERRQQEIRRRQLTEQMLVSKHFYEVSVSVDGRWSGSSRCPFLFVLLLSFSNTHTHTRAEQTLLLVSQIDLILLYVRLQLVAACWHLNKTKFVIADNNCDHFHAKSTNVFWFLLSLSVNSVEEPLKQLLDHRKASNFHCYQTMKTNSVVCSFIMTLLSI